MSQATPSSSGGSFDRRGLLTGAAVATAAAGAAIAIASRDEAAAAASAVTALNVGDAPYGARGNGADDDRAAIQRALDDVGESGAAVYFPPGDYLVSEPLVPRSRTLLYGSHTPRWDKPEQPPSACRIRMAPRFDGDALLRPENDTAAITIRNVALVGDGTEAPRHGILMPEATDTPSWTLEGVTVAGFGGDGLHGRFHTSTLHNCFLYNNRGFGINASDGARWNDCHVANCFLFYNRAGNLYFGGGETSAAIQFVNCRFERAGTNPLDVFAPLNAAAPGIRLASARYIHFVNCDTDANTGNGLEIVRERGSEPGPPHFVLASNCRFGRDGTGRNGRRQETAEEFAGVKVAGLVGDGPASHVQMANCLVTYGKASDEGEGSVFGPRYGVWYENTSDFQWVGGGVTMPPGAEARAYHAGTADGGNDRAAIVDFERGLMTLPTTAPDAGLPIPDGAIYLDASAQRLMVRSGGSWRAVRFD